MKMKFIETIIAILVAVIALFSIEGCKKPTTRKIVIKGSTTVLPITQRAVEVYRMKNKISISVEGSGSGNGIKAIIDGSCDIANSSREMSKGEVAKAKKKGVNVKEIAVAYDMIVPIVNLKNKVTNLTMAQLKGIYDGSIKNWKEVGGEDATIVVISRDTSSGTYEVWEKKVMKKARIRKDALLQASNGTIQATVASNRKAIGYIGYGYLNKTVKTLKVDGVIGTIENGKSGKFPVSRKLYMYVNKDKISKDTQDFVAFILGTEGQKLVKEVGYIPL